MQIDLDDVIWAQGQDNDAGLAEEHYYCLKDDILTFPAVAATPTTFASRSTLVGDFTMKQDRFFKRIYCTLEKGKVVSTQVGPRDGKSYENKATLFFPGNTPTMAGFLEALKNSRVVLVLRQMDGTMVVLGSDKVGAEIDAAEIDSGQAIADGRGATYTIRSIPRIAPFYDPPAVNGKKQPPLVA